MLLKLGCIYLAVVLEATGCILEHGFYLNICEKILSYKVIQQKALLIQTDMESKASLTCFFFFI
jgi:hypothetical protein